MATIKFYTLGENKLKYLQAGKLLSIDDFAVWLASTGSATSVSDVQYIKNGLEIGINLDLSQTYAQPDQKIHYVSIQNTGESTIYYYFVKNTTWRAKSTVRLELVMDVLNTFKDGTDYTFKENTRINREHKNRFKIVNRKITIQFYIVQEVGYLQAGDTIDFINEHGDLCFSGVIDDIDEQRTTITITSSQTNEQIEDYINDFIEDPFEMNKNASNYYLITFTEDDWEIYLTKFRDIDYVRENINPILQNGSAEGTKIEHSKSLLQTDWYLLYRNQEDPNPDSLVNPVECYLIPESEMEISTGSITTAQITPATLEAGKIYFIPIYCRGITDAYIDFTSYNQSLTLSNGVSIGGHDYTDEVSYVAVTKNQDNTLNIVFNKLVYDNNSGAARFALSQEIIYKNIPYITIEQSPTYYGKSTSNTLTTIEIFEDLLNTIDRESFTYTGTGLHINGIDLLDKTDAKNIKLIKLPYCPYDFNITGDKVDIVGTNWNYEDLEQADHSHIKMLKLNDLNTKLNGSFDINDASKNPLPNLLKGSFTPALTDLRKDASFESKLYHSEFYQPTYVYDSFAFRIQLEKCDIDSYISSRKLTIKFTTTRTINSKFMFTFATYYLRNGEENYAKYLPIARNNEEVLYNVPYVNYIRTGYQYDIKNKNISNISNAIGIGLSAGSMAVSLAMPSAPLKIAGVVASFVSMAMSVKNAVVSAQQNENSINQKLQQYQNQAASVSGSDDVDLMSEYAENRLKYLVYEPTAVMKDLLFKLFFYAGYSSNKMGVPTHNNRVNFDYLECDAVIETTNKNMTQEIISEIVNCYKNGVTFIHRTSRIVDIWDIEQKYENWEKIFF